jgi:DNA-binding LacI/PurR family transcriptional regulator
VRQASREHGLPELRAVTIPQARARARQAVAEFLAAQPPFAICAFNDEVAFTAPAVLADLEIAVPDAVSVISHDNTMIAELSNPPLTTIGLETPDLTERLIASVLSVCQGGPALGTLRLQAKVIVRASAWLRSPTAWGMATDVPPKLRTRLHPTRSHSHR